MTYWVEVARKLALQTQDGPQLGEAVISAKPVFGRAREMVVSVVGVVGLSRSSRTKRLVVATTIPLTARLFMRGQLAYLRSCGWDVTLVSSPGSDLDATGRREDVSVVEIGMVRDVSPGVDAIGLLKWVMLLFKVRPTAVCVGTPKAALLGLLASFATRVPRRVYLVRGLRYEGATGRKRKILMVAEWLSCHLASDVVAVSKSVGEKLRSDGVQTGPVLLIGEGSSNGVLPFSEKCSLAEARAKARAALDVDESEFVVGFVGRASKDKGIDTLLAAGELLQRVGASFSIAVVGDKVSSPRPVAGHSFVRHLGWVDDPRSLMAGFDVLVLPSIREGFPNVVLEAATVAVPSVVTNATGARDSVVDGTTGLTFDVGDSQGLADLLLSLIESDSFRRRLGGAARLRAETLFAPETIWRGLDSVLSGFAAEDSNVRQL